MKAKVTDVRGLHAGKLFQENLLLKNSMSPGRDLLAMRLLGIKDDLLKKHAINNDVKETTLCKKIVGEEEIENFLNERNLHLCKNETLKKLFDEYKTNQTIKSSRLNVSWTKNAISKNHKDTTEFNLDNSDEMERIVKELLNFEGEEGYHNLLVLFPVSDLFNTQESESMKLGWDIYEQTYNGETDSKIDGAALLVALQILELGNLSNTTCFNLVNNTCLINNFEPIDLETLDENYFRKYFVSSRAVFFVGYNDKTIHASIVDKRSKPFKNVSLRNSNKEELDKKELLNLEQSLSNIDNLKKSDEDLCVNGLDIRQVELINKSPENKNLDKQFETIAYGLRILLSQVPGVLCKIKIPFNENYYGRTPAGRKPKKSDTLILGPKYWINFLENSFAKKGKKPGSDDRKLAVKAGNDESTEVVYDFGYCIHNMGHLAEDPKK